ncbi:MAG: hypothetical protein EBS05_03995 [Proteobacteria bacterium]|nr:hypothetical protein [Pseudomonadota bacterium]
MRFALWVCWLAWCGLGLTAAQAASPYAGFYTGYVYSSISGTITVAESAIGAAGFTVDSNGNITGNLTGTVDGSGNITWNANQTGFTTGTISGGVLASTTSQNNGGAVTTFRIAANNSAGGFGGGATVAQSLVWRQPTPTGASLRGVTYGGGKFVAVGPGGSVAISGDGTNWLAANANTTKQLNAVAYGNGVYVAVGDGATAISSPDAITWTARSLGGSPNQNFIGVAYGNGTFVAVNLVNEVFVSTDGIAWTKVVNSSLAAFWNNLKFVGGMFVLVGQNNANGRISTSANGSTWSTEVTPASGGIADVTFGNGKWAAVASTGTRIVTFANAAATDATVGTVSGLGVAIGFVNGLFVSDNRYYSADALTWKRDSYPNLSIRAFANGNSLLAAVGAAITTSTDGKNWIVQTKVLPLATVNNVGANGVVSGNIYDEIQYVNAQSFSRYLRLGVGGLIDERATLSVPYTNVVSPTPNTLRDGIGHSSGGVAVGDSGTIVRYSTGVGAWTNVPSGTVANLRSLAGPDAINFVAVGAGGTILRSANGGATWTASTSNTTNQLNRVAWMNGTGFNYYVAVGDNGVIRKSTDGTTWTSLTSGTTKRLVGISNLTVGNVKLVAVAEDSTVVVSEDHGTTWRSITVNAPFAITYSDGAGARGVGGFQMTTSDGTNWTYTLPGVGTLMGVGHGNGRFIALASQVRLSSTDLNTWSAAPVSYSHNALVFGNGILVSVGGGSSTEGRGYVSTSVDGSQWVDRLTPTMISLNAVTYAQGKFVAVGDSATILNSTNGVDWVNRTPAVNASALRGVAYGNGVFVAIGAGSILRYSTDGDTWVTSGTSGTTLNSITFANGIFVGVGDNGAVRSSVDGITWTARTTTPSHNRVLQTVRYAGGRFIAVGNLDSSGEGAVVVHSTDGTNWTKEVANVANALRSSAVAAGNYVAVGDSGTVVSASVQDTGSPIISGQPTPDNQTVSAGTTVTYTVTSPSAGLQYRWLKDGTPMADGPGVTGSDTATLTLTGVDVLDTAVYQVSIWNTAASALSLPVSLAVNGPPIITSHPLSVTTSNLLTTNFTVAAVGPGPFTYLWRANGQPLTNGGKFGGATTSKLTITGITGTNEGAYDVIVSNSFGGSLPSNPAQLTVLRPPTIIQPPVATNLTQGQSFTLSVVADGSPTLLYQWKHAGTNLTDGGRVSGATNATLTITGAQVSDGGGYTVSVTNAFTPGTISSSVYVSVLGPGAFVPQLTYNGTGLIYDIVPTGDGKFLVAGDGGLTFSGSNWFGLVKVDSNGVPVLTFATTNAGRAPSGTVRSIAPQADGQIVVGGSFVWGGTNTYSYAARLSADGVLDTTYVPAPALIVKKVLPLAGGQIVLGRTGLGFSTSRVTRYTSTGTLDGTFTEVVNANRELHGLAMQSDGTLWMSGVFGLKKSNADGTNPTNLTTYAPFPEMFKVFVGPDDKVYYSDNNGQYFGRLNPDGSRDTSFVMTIGGHVMDMAFLPDGRLVIVGDFQTVNSVTNAYVSLLESNGTSVAGFTSPYTWSAATLLNAIKMLGDGSALVGGSVLITLPTNQRYLQRIQITAPAAPAPTFAEWKADKGLPVGQDGPNDDPDGDGLPNVVEFAFGTHPMQSQSRVLPANRVYSENGENYPSVVMIRRKSLTGATILVDAFTTLPFNSAVGTTQVGQPEDLGDGTERVTIRSQTPLRTLQGFYFRTRVQVP